MIFIPNVVSLNATYTSMLVHKNPASVMAKVKVTEAIRRGGGGLNMLIFI